MIQGIFYARFLPQEGTKIVAQSPPGCIVASQFAAQAKPPLVDFDIIQEYIIPRKAFFNRFVTVNTPDDKYSILGFPVSIVHERYDRNEFIFNFGLVVESDCDFIPYERLVRRLATTFAEMEKQGGYLSSEGRLDDGRRPIESLLEIVKEDLNNYGECMIPIDEANTINMKLFPYHAPPPPVRGWHVPVPKMKLAEIVDPTWDLTLQKLIPHIDGVNDVRRIAWLADVSLPLTQTALQHLLYYDTILLLDMFFFGSCYAPRPGIHDFIANRDGMVDECAAYVCLGGIAPSDDVSSGSTSGRATPSANISITPAPAATTAAAAAAAAAPSNSTASNPTEEATTTTAPPPPPLPPSTSNPALSAQQRLSNYQLIRLMTTFCVGRSVMEWVKLHTDAGLPVLRLVDVRRLVQFGVIRGLLYRVHRYVVSKQYLAQLATGQARPIPLARGDDDRRTGGRGGGGDGGGTADNGAAAGANGRDGKKAAEDRSARTTSAAEVTGVGRGRAATVGNGNGRDPLQKYTDGCHSFDQIITEQNMTTAEIVNKLWNLQTPDRDLTEFYR